MDKWTGIFFCVLVISVMSALAEQSAVSETTKVSCNNLKAAAIAASQPEPKCAQ